MRLGQLVQNIKGLTHMVYVTKFRRAAKQLTIGINGGAKWLVTPLLQNASILAANQHGTSAHTSVEVLNLLLDP
ncbi:hypothetical protein BHS05_04570 [Myxococcus xanthus]|uniref:Uncharacterized protein n=1 Tax=Myxococcus xanthus TaxID=34 RepID=A0AAE6KQQ6_MYXXA|nr:hypothetical protein BHS09_04545 [Myxococcus xanthus]QDE73597.1 hypothetical protein BHS08_04550 [Myxococcus xanthus]QDE95192.1 hypothetical protein BHS05_04570 [Myxococcus xanthus]